MTTTIPGDQDSLSTNIFRNKIMQNFSVRVTIIGVLFTVLSLAACGDSDKATTSALDSVEGVLRFVPADTPYLVATPGEFPDELMDKLEPQLDQVLKAYHSIIRALMENAYATAREENTDMPSYEKLLPVVDELEGLMSVKGLRAAGIERSPEIAVYGVGLLPVFRLSLSDSSLLEAAISRLEEQAEQKMKVASVDGQSYRYVGDDEGRLVVAIIDNDLVIAVVPSALSEDLLKQVLGITLPARNIAASGELVRLAEAYGFNDYMIGVVDLERIAATFLEPQSGIDAELLSLMEYDDSELTDVCRSEIRSMAGIMPRMVVGYTELNTRRMTSKAVLELREDIAAGVATLTGAVPGMTEPQGGLFSVGMSMDLLAARTFYSARLDALEAEPWECELFAEFQNGVTAGRDVLNQPVPPVVYGFKGFLAVIEKLEGMDLANSVPPTSVDMRLLLAMENAAALIAMGTMFSPELAAMNIEPNGQPVQLEMAQIEATGMEVHVAMTENGLGLSVGDDMADGLDEMLNAEVSEPSPFLVVDMDTERYYQLINEMMSAQSGNSDGLPEIRAAAQAISQSMQSVMERMRMVVNFTQHGVEIESEVQLSE
jgi:hypothetical protein